METQAKRIGMPVHQNVECPKCGSTIGFGAKIVNQNVVCPGCNEPFHYDDGLLARLSKVPFHVLFLLPIRMGFIQSGRVSLTPGEIHEIKFQKPFHKVSTIILTNARGNIMEIYEDNEMVATPISPSENGFFLATSKKDPLSNLGAREVNWWAAGSESDEQVPVWHIFLQNAIDLIRKEEYPASVVVSLMSFDAYLSELLAVRMREKGLSPEFMKSTILSGRYGRYERLSTWLKEFFGKSFSESPYNESLKKFSDLRNRIVHPSVEGFDEKEITQEIAINAFEIVIKSMKWMSDLKRTTPLARKDKIQVDRLGVDDIKGTTNC